MSDLTSDYTGPAPLTREAAEALAATLAAEMIRCWREGERRLPEEFLRRHPELWDHPEAAADLIYEELCLRQEHGPEVPLEEVLARFPQWRPQLEVLFDCQRLLGPRRPEPRFPATGEFLGDFLLLAELGRGAQGRVFLASQLSLGDRPVVVKLGPAEAREHLSLARLQHTHIVPLYSVQDHPSRGLRSLCMPYFGGGTLAQVLEALRTRPPARRTGQLLVDALDRAQAAAPVVAAARGPARHALAGAAYPEAVCQIGADLADALQYAHDRGLVHLDVKPSNVLLAADGQPMLLDFHLAREPLHPEAAGPAWLGGTEGYMPPEQEEAVFAVRLGRAVPRPVDGRADVYGLGVVLYEALAGSRPGPGTRARSLCRLNPQVSVGLADVVCKCLAADPDDRYPHPADLAADLRRHLAHRPLAGVRNRSLAERWQKWRRRRPHGAALAMMMLAVLTAAGAVTAGAVGHFTQRVREARAALTDGLAQAARGRWEEAIGTLRRGLAAARGVPFRGELADELEGRLRRAEEEQADAERAAAAAELHHLADRVRFFYGADDLGPGGLDRAAAWCRPFWADRARVVARLTPPGHTGPGPEVRDDLLDMAIFWADLEARLAGRARALAVLDQAEALVGPSPVLGAERRRHGAATAPAAHRPGARTAWEHYALGRSLLRTGDLDGAAAEVSRAVRLQPQGLWPNFYQGLCAYRQGRYADAALAYSVCIGAAPGAAGCFYNRGRALEALGQSGPALADYDQALRLDPTLAPAALNRGLLHFRAGRSAPALADLDRARQLGADPAVVLTAAARVYLARGERAAALDHVRQALRLDPTQPDARRLRDLLRERDRRPSSAPK